MLSHLTSEVFDRAMEMMNSFSIHDDLLERICELIKVTHIVYSTSISNVDPTITPLVRSTYPAVWLKRYIDMSYERVDPVLKRGYASSFPFRWSEIEDQDRAAVAMMSDAARHGIGPQGLSIPVIAKTGRRGLFSISSLEPVDIWDLFVAANLPALKEIAFGLHKQVGAEICGEPALHLTARELECLAWCARGKEASDIAIILGISPHTVRDYLKSTRFKLGCSNLPQAVAKGIALGFITAA